MSYQRCMWPGLRLVTSRSLSGLSDTCLTINVVVADADVAAVAGCFRC